MRINFQIRDVPSNYDEIYLHYAREGARVLCLGYKEMGNLTHQQVRDLTRQEIENDLKFVGFVVISCPLKPDTKSVVKEILNSTHHITMITGDNPLTACHVASQLRLIDKKSSIVLSKQNEEMPDSEWVWKSTTSDKFIRPLEYALEQQNYPKPVKVKGSAEPASTNDAKLYRNLCLTGEVDTHFKFYVIERFYNNKCFF